MRRCEKSRALALVLSLLLTAAFLPSAVFAQGSAEINTETSGEVVPDTEGESSLNALENEITEEGTKAAEEAVDPATETDDGIGESTEDVNDDAEDGEDIGDSDDSITDKVPFSIPRIILKMESQADIDSMNASKDHSVKIKGKMDLLVPDGFRYVDQPDGVELKEFNDISLDYLRGRGNTTWRHSGKRPYKIKLSKKTSLLGLDKNKHWALVANAFDKSMLRNRLTYWLGNRLGMEYTPTGYPVDVFMDNGEGVTEYYGSYLLCKIPKNSVGIEELTEDISDGIELTGGYLLSVIQHPDTASAFTTRKKVELENIVPSFDPDEGDYENDAQKDYIRNYVQEAEDALFEGETVDEGESSGYRQLDYKDYFDVEAASLYWLMQEFSMNGDAYGTGSSYFYKDRDAGDVADKIHWGPLWDFDFAWDYGNNYVDMFQSNMTWMTAMMYDKSDGAMPDLIKSRDWPKLKVLLEEAVKDGGLLDQFYEETRVSQAADYKLNGEKYTSVWGEDQDQVECDLAEDYESAVDDLHQWIIKRMIWVSDNIDTLDEYSRKVTIKVSEDDKHPQVFYFRNGYLFSADLEEPKQDGKVFIGWYTDDDKFLQEISINKDTVATAKYVDEKEAAVVDITRSPIYIKIGDARRLQYAVEPYLTKTEIFFDSEDAGIVYVNNNGVIYGRAKGKAIVYITGSAEDEDGNIYDIDASCEVIVSDSEESLMPETKTSEIDGKTSNPKDVANSLVSDDDDEDQKGRADSPVKTGDETALIFWIFILVSAITISALFAGVRHFFSSNRK